MSQSAIFDEYLRSNFDLPQVDANIAKFPQFLLCPMGFVGSGKSTCLTQIIKSLPFHVVRISTDDLRHLVIRSGKKPVKEEIDGAYLQLVRHYVQRGYPVACDSNCLRLYSNIEAITLEFRMRAFWLKVDPPESYIIRKLRGYNHTWLFRDAGHAVERYFHHKNKMTDLGNVPSDMFILDPSSEDFDRQVSLVCSSILCWIDQPHELG